MYLSQQSDRMTESHNIGDSIYEIIIKLFNIILTDKCESATLDEGFCIHVCDEPISAGHQSDVNDVYQKYAYTFYTIVLFMTL